MAFGHSGIVDVDHIKSLLENFVPLPQISILNQRPAVYSGRLAVTGEDRRFIGVEARARCQALSAGLNSRGMKPGDMASVLDPIRQTCLKHISAWSW